MRAVAVPDQHSHLGDLITLAKVRVNALVVATTAGGYYMAAPASVEPIGFVVTCLGTALVASGAAAINQVWERDTDKMMERTRMRPVADGRIGPAEGRVVAAVLSLVGLTAIWLASNGLAAATAFVTLVSYAAIYTPLKRRTSLATVVGAVPGALPPLIGWAAARGTLAEPGPWVLFLIMFVWQLPHFLAIAWRYRGEYAEAGLPMLPVVDHDGAMTGRQAAVWAATLVPLSILPTLLGMTGSAYAIGAILLGLMQAALAFRFAFNRSDENARQLFYASIIYLPLLWMLMVFSRQ